MNYLHYLNGRPLNFMKDYLKFCLWNVQSKVLNNCEILIGSFYDLFTI